MCNVWKKENQHDYEMNADEIGKVFSQKLFKKVKHIGLSGGEPFVRNDIDKIIKEIIKNLPQLKGISIISNGTLTNKIMEKLPIISKICEDDDKYISIAFSIDGIEEIHNIVRGNGSSFKSLINTLNGLKKMNFNNISLCCTITKYNLDNLYQVLEFAKERKIYIKFRVATRIERLHNENLEDNYNFTREEKIKIAKFYDKLVAQYEKSWHQKFYYMATKEQLLNGSKRQTGCDWRNKGISLDAEGNLYYCFVKSPKLCSLLKNDGWNYYKNNRNVRYDIIKKHCDNCIHDYVGNIDLSLKFNILLKKVLIRLEGRINKFKLSYINNNILKLIQKKDAIKLQRDKKVIFITGWYGTETTGDKAILAGIYNKIVKYNPKTEFIISSIVPYYTEETVNELGFKNTTIVGRNTKEEANALKKSDLVVMGGGPLMDIEETIDIMWTFYKAIKIGIPTCVYCCGLGPLNVKKYKNVVENILKLSSYAFTRDENSIKSYEDIVSNINIIPNIDPAVAYLLDYKNKTHENNKRVLACIRDWPQNYTKIQDKGKFNEIKENYLLKLCEGIKMLINDGYSVEFFPMNTFYYGDDDRDYYNNIKEKLIGYEDKIKFYEKEYTTQETVEIFKQHSMIIGMRFHSVVFGNTLCIPTIAIDYDSNKGKIYGFMKTIGLEENYVSINDMIKGDVFVKKIKELNSQITFNKLSNYNGNLMKLVDVPPKKIFDIKDVSYENITN
jgi:polysaccharide pyruvyl transferase WcaK-like protein/molybdenum cofactor biosynthesis enzyme MoaA